LSLTNPLRRACIVVNDSWQFDRFILAFIASNAVVLCLMQPTKLEGRGCASTGSNASTSGAGNAAMEDSELVFTTVFTLEMLVKIIAMGFYFEKGSYLSDGWNVMDFLVVVVSLVSLLPGIGGGVSALRVVRVLRPLRSLSVMPGMRTLIDTMLRAIPMIGNVLLFCVFFFTVFGIFGLQTFMGALRNRCFTLVDDATCDQFTSVEDVIMCRGDVAGMESGVAVLLAEHDERTCETGSAGTGTYECPSGQRCMKAHNPAYGLIHFDNAAHAFLTIFQCITLEGWTPIMYMAMDAVTGWSVAYFLLLVFFGGFFLLNLALAVITEVYDEESAEAKFEAEQAEDTEEAKQERLMEERIAKRKAVIEHIGVGGDESDSDSDAGSSAMGIRGGASTGSFIDAVFGPLGNGKRKGGVAAIRSVVESPRFGTFFTSLILANTLALAMEYEGMSDTYADSLAACNLALTISFALEMVLKIAGLGPREYVQDSFNIFDAVVVLLSLAELALANSGSLSALRSFRILRVLKLVRSWKGLQRFLYTVYLTVMSLGEFAFIVVLTIFIFALLGMQMFGGKMCGLGDDGDTPRHNFDTLLWALVTVFQVLTGEDWNAVMYDGVAASGSWSSLYFVALLIIGNFLVLNLFIAILLTNFSAQEISSDMKETRKLLESISFFNTYMSKERGLTEKSPAELELERWWSELPDKKMKHGAEKRWTKLATLAYDRVLEAEEAERIKREERMRADEEKRAKRLEAERQAKYDELNNPEQMSWASALFCGLYDPTTLATPQPGNAPKRLEAYRAKSLKIFSRDNPIRKACFALCDDHRFDAVVMAFIATSSIMMVFESPRAMENDSFADALDAVDTAFIVIFACEMAVKLVAYGLWLEERKGTYLRDPWNCLDGFIVLVGIVGKIMSGANLGWVRALRTLRALRPLRVIQRVPALKVVVNALLRSLPGLGNVMLVALLFWLIFGILGMQLFMGAFARCDDPDVAARVDCVDGWVNETRALAWNPVAKSCLGAVSVSTESACAGTYAYSEYRERSWSSDDMNFDNVFNAMQTLFEMSTTEGWTAVMYNGVDSTSPDTAPERDNNPPMAFFFIAFEIVANFFILNLFIGIILDNFTQMAQESGDGGSATMTKEQKLWAQRKKNFFKEAGDEVNKQTSPWRSALFKFSHDERFDFTIMGFIVLNAAAMACEHYQQSDTWTVALEGVSIGCSAVFIFEATVKLLAMGPRLYFAERWNQFDFFCVVMSIIGFAFGTGGGASVLRVLRLARLFRLVRRLKGLRMLFNTVIISMPGIINIGGLLFLLCFVYAVLGMHLFGKVKFGETHNEHANFRDFGNSLLTLLRMVTGEAWNSIMYDVMVKDDCDSSDECAIGECCGVAGAPLYFITFVIFGSFVTLNLLIAVVVDTFSNQKKEEEGEDVTDEDIEQFKIAWIMIDRKGEGRIPASRVAELVRRTPPPLGLKGTRVTALGMVRFMKKLDIGKYCIGEDEVLHYEDALVAFMRRSMNLDVGNMPEVLRVEVMETLRSKSTKSAKNLADAAIMTDDDESDDEWAKAKKRGRKSGATASKSVVIVDGKERASLRKK
jgi:hypothetical protein